MKGSYQAAQMRPPSFPSSFISIYHQKMLNLDARLLIKVLKFKASQQAFYAKYCKAKRMRSSKSWEDLGGMA
jgi:hypothetical protein